MGGGGGVEPKFSVQLRLKLNNKMKNKLWLKLCQAHVQFRLNSDKVRGEDCLIKSVSTNIKLDRHVKSLINRSKIGSTDQKSDQHVRGGMNISKFGSTDQKLDQRIKS